MRALNVGRGGGETGGDGAVLDAGGEGLVREETLAGGAVYGLARADRGRTAVEVVDRDERGGFESAESRVVAVEEGEEGFSVFEL